jgi:SAM-dependent methyltransferase
VFDANVYAQIAAGCLSSAEVVVPEIIELIEPATVLDVGCGEGWWLSVFARYGCDVHGVDGDGYGQLAIASERFHVHDLATDPSLDVGEFDLVTSLEVAEHLPAHRADWFIDELCAHAKIVLFSAAIPHQGGNGHINEQWPDYWVERFDRHGYVLSGALRWRFWTDERVECWYSQNMLLAVERSELARRPKLEALFGPGSAPLGVVHPMIWGWKV